MDDKRFWLAAGITGVLAPFILGFFIALSLWRAYALWLAWGWIAVDQYAAPSINFWHSWVVCIAVAMLTHQNGQEETRPLWKQTINFIAQPAVFLLIAWLVR